MRHAIARTMAAQARRRSCGLTFAVVIVGCLLAGGATAQTARVADYEVKAAYLYNFGRFVDWPANNAASKQESFNVCVLGEGPIAPALEATLAGETIGGKKVAARRIASMEGLDKCQILFLSSIQEDRLQRIIEALDKNAVLTVSDMPHFSQRGGMIEFVTEGKRVRFEVNLAATRHAGLTLSSELLKVAAVVRKGPGD